MADEDERIFCTWSYRAALPPSLHNKFGDLDQLIRQQIGMARATILMVSPYLSPDGLRSLRPALAVAAGKGVWIRLVTSDLEEASSLNRRAIVELLSGADGSTVQGRLRVLAPAPDFSPLLHAKLIVSDGRSGYLGSANLSRQGLDANFEIGVSLSSKQAHVLEDMFMFLEARSHIREVEHLL